MDGGGGGSNLPEIRLAPSRVNHVPEVNPATRARLLTRIMKDQAQFLGTKSQPSDDFGSADLSWYWESSDKRTRNLEYMYRAILNHCTARRPMEDKRVLNALSALCEGSLRDPKFKHVRFGLPNWFTSALLLWMTMMRINAAANANGSGAQAGAAAGAAGPAAGAVGGGNGKAGGDPAAEGQGHGQPSPPAAAGPGRNGRGGLGLLDEVLSPFVVEQCQPQVKTFLRFIEMQLLAEEFLYLHIKDRPNQQPRIWVSRSGLPPLPVAVVLGIVRLIKALFTHDVGVGEMAVKAEKTVEEVMNSPPNPAITFTFAGGGVAAGAPAGHQQQLAKA